MLCKKIKMSRRSKKN